MYVVWMLADFFPFSLLVFVAPLATWRRWREQPASVPAFAGGGGPLVVYSVFSSKNAKYLLPAYPLVAILLGARLGELLDSAGPWLRRGLLGLALLLPTGYAAFYAVAEARLLDYRYTAFPQFTGWLAGVGETPLYGYLSLDERLIYYARRDIPHRERRGVAASARSRDTTCCCSWRALGRPGCGRRPIAASGISALQAGTRCWRSHGFRAARRPVGRFQKLACGALSPSAKALQKRISSGIEIRHLAGLDLRLRPARTSPSAGRGGAS